ncbi:MAG: hypothetical protein V4585_00365 [Bacteroidota bacterium]
MFVEHRILKYKTKLFLLLDFLEADCLVLVLYYPRFVGFEDVAADFVEVSPAVSLHLVDSVDVGFVVSVVALRHFLAVLVDDFAADFASLVVVLHHFLADDFDFAVSAVVLRRFPVNGFGFAVFAVDLRRFLVDEAVVYFAVSAVVLHHFLADFVVELVVAYSLFVLVAVVGYFPFVRSELLPEAYLPLDLSVFQLTGVCYYLL